MKTIKKTFGIKSVGEQERFLQRNKNMATKDKIFFKGVLSKLQDRTKVLPKIYREKTLPPFMEDQF